MSFDWREFLTLAEGLASNPDSLGSPEASFRSAASRHHPPDKTYRKISIQLNRLRDIRVKADYQSSLQGTPDFLASSAIGMAKIILECLNTLT